MCRIYLICQLLDNRGYNVRYIWTHLVQRWYFAVQDIVNNFHWIRVGKRQCSRQHNKEGNTQAVEISSMVWLECSATCLFWRHVNKRLPEIMRCAVSLNRFSPSFRGKVGFQTTCTQAKIPNFDSLILGPQKCAQFDFTVNDCAEVRLDDIYHSILSLTHTLIFVQEF